MKTRALIAGLLLAATSAVAGDGVIRRSTRHVPGHYVAVLDSTASVDSVATLVRSFANSRVHNTYQRGVKGFALEMSDADAQRLARDPRVQFVEEDSIVNTAATTSWGLDRIDQRALPLDNSYIPIGIGSGISVYIVDTGILASHVDFNGRVTAGFSAFNDGNGSNDCNGHGTSVAGIVGGSTYGVASGATLVPVRVLDCTGTGTVSSILAGLDWVLSDHQLSGMPGVVNMSLSGAPSSALDSEVDNLLVAGLTTVVAAGNNNDIACSYSPARVPGALTVGATTQSDQRSTFSNFGSCVDLFAPGQAIATDSYSGDTATVVSSGTSFAAPFVAGAAALVLEKYPTATPADVNQTIVTQATAGALAGIGDGSPNLLLYSTILELDPGVAQILSDAGFDYGTTFWTSTVCDPTNPSGCYPGDFYDMMAASAASHSGNTHASLGGQAPDVQFTSEAVTIPSHVTKAQLGFYLWVYTKGQRPKVDSTLRAQIRDANGNVLETLGTYTNLDASTTYVQRIFDVTRYRGIPIRISFESIETNGPATWFLLDDTTLKVWQH